MAATLPDADLQASLELLRSHAATSPTAGGEDQSPSAHSASAVSPHGYSDIAAAASQAHRAVTDAQRGQGPKEDDYIHPDLRAHATSMMPTTPGNLAPAANMMPSSVPLATMPPSDPSPPAPEQQVLAPAPPTPVQQHPPQPQGDNEESPNNRRGKRELSQSKRAAQNRAAQVCLAPLPPQNDLLSTLRPGPEVNSPQRAFRRRKEEYIKKLEQRVNETEQLDQLCRYLVSQHNSFREYVSTLQSELVEAQGKFPAPPQNLNFNPQTVPTFLDDMPRRPGATPPPPQISAPQEPLAAIAQAVMTPPAPMGDRQQQEDREEGQDAQDDIDRSVAMQVDSLP